MRKFSVIPMKAALAIAMLLMTGNSLAQDNSVYVPRNSVALIYNNQTNKTYQRNYTYNGSDIESVRPESPSATFQLRTNGLYDLALCPNIGLEFQTSLGLAFQFDYVGAWWNSPSKNRFFSNYGFQSEIRYYFKKDNPAIPFRGLHVGVYGQMVTYDFEFGGEGYQCPALDDSFGLGISGGYSMPISKKWNIDFTLGLGYFQSKYSVYEPNVNNTKWIETNKKRLKFWGPTKAEVTFVYNLNKRNKK